MAGPWEGAAGADRTGAGAGAAGAGAGAAGPRADTAEVAASLGAGEDPGVGAPLGAGEDSELGAPLGTGGDSELGAPPGAGEGSGAAPLGAGEGSGAAPLGAGEGSGVKSPLAAEARRVRAGAGSAGPWRGTLRRGAAVPRATPESVPGAAGDSSCPGAAGSSSCPGTDWVTSAAAMPVVATSPATCAPVVRPGHYSIGARQSGMTGSARWAPPAFPARPHPALPSHQPAPSGEEGTRARPPGPAASPGRRGHRNSVLTRPCCPTPPPPKDPRAAPWRCLS